MVWSGEHIVGRVQDSVAPEIHYQEERLTGSRAAVKERKRRPIAASDIKRTS